MENLYEKVVKKMFEGVEEYIEDRDMHEVSFKVQWSEVTYDALAEMALIMGTKLINFHSVTRSWGYCETCGGSEQFTKVDCSGVKFEESDPDHECTIVEGASVDINENN